METNLKIALVQSSIFWHQPEENRTHFTEIIRNLTRAADLVILPEMFSTGFTMTPSEIDQKEGNKTLEWMKSLALETKMAITGSIAFFEGGSYTNRLFFVKPNGSFEYYDKRHTFTLAGEQLSYSAGKKRVIIDYGGFRICPMICYDLRFPVWSRNTEAYDLLLFVANWPQPRVSAWDALLRARAIENMAYCIGVNRIGNDPNGHNYNGHSACYDALGEQLVFSEKEEVLFVEISKTHLTEAREKLRFLDDRDSFILQ
ncbi:amidohydrolase [Muriicola soli]|uniref:Omega-amidase YafV n=1 Tax=Muriicola soli TaxID=2507538 RepID=A0A411ECB7_9FLAO|nr:amidohydrolase [Muriicola soli]QBA65183.1 amidohydrolase [Muriicola soli]